MHINGSMSNEEINRLIQELGPVKLGIKSHADKIDDRTFAMSDAGLSNIREWVEARAGLNRDLIESPASPDVQARSAMRFMIAKAAIQRQKAEYDLLHDFREAGVQLQKPGRFEGFIQFLEKHHIYSRTTPEIEAALKAEKEAHPEFFNSGPKTFSEIVLNILRHPLQFLAWVFLPEVGDVLPPKGK